MTTHSKIGLVLGGGGSRGLAHVGVLKVFVREGIPIDFIVGTSMGGIVGVLFALGYHPAEIGQGISRLQQNSLFNLSSLTARSRQQRVRDNLSEILDGKTFADLSIPVTLMAVDMCHGQEVMLTQGELVPALLASSAVPGAFPPVQLNGQELADGGVLDSLATHVAFKQGADKIIAVDVYPELDKDNPWTDPFSGILGLELPIVFNGNGAKKQKPPSLPAALWRSVRVITWHLHQQRLENHPPDILMRPSVDTYASLDFREIDLPIQAGVEEAERHLDALRSLAGDRRVEYNFEITLEY
ncbi:MAG: patatin-like phospholipase family protein [Anaerolineae bacterium]|nr:patatin-like phospholipase family protein [Anaerolineae bacterium]